MDHYPYRVRWSAEDQAYVGTGAELPSLSGLADTQEDAFSGIRELVTNVLDAAEQQVSLNRLVANRLTSA